MDSALALFLDYPEDDLVAARAQVATDAPPRLRAFARWWADARPRELRERYVADFDLRSGTALYLTHHRFGDRRERGRALIALKRLYREAGWEPSHWELPDYLPLVLELAAADPGVGLPLLAEYRPELETIHRSLVEVESPWADVLAVVLDELAGAQPAPRSAGFTERRPAGLTEPRTAAGASP